MSQYWFHKNKSSGEIITALAQIKRLKIEVVRLNERVGNLIGLVGLESTVGKRFLVLIIVTVWIISLFLLIIDVVDTATVECVTSLSNTDVAMVGKVVAAGTIGMERREVLLKFYLEWRITQYPLLLLPLY